MYFLNKKGLVTRYSTDMGVLSHANRLIDVSRLASQYIFHSRMYCRCLWMPNVALADPYNEVHYKRIVDLPSCGTQRLPLAEFKCRLCRTHLHIYVSVYMCDVLFSWFGIRSRDDDDYYPIDNRGVRERPVAVVLLFPPTFLLPRCFLHSISFLSFPFFFPFFSKERSESRH